MAAGVQHIAYTSSVGIHPHSPAFVVADHLHTEERLRKCGVAFTVLRDSQYAEVVATMIAPLALATGKWVTSAGEGRMAFVRSPDNISIELLQKGEAKPAAEPWKSMANTGVW